MSSESIVLGSLLADAICLGPHWVYDQAQISSQITDAARFHAPISPYHPGKKAGDLTHYGDQVMVLLKHLAESQAVQFNLAAYADAWHEYWQSSDTISYRDGATKETLANLAKGVSPDQAGAASHDLAGASIIAPLFLLHWSNDDVLLSACRSLTAFTHHQSEVIDAAAFIARTTLAASRGRSITTALAEAASLEKNAQLLKWYSAAKVSAVAPVTDAVALAEFGLSCNIDGGFAGMCHLLLRYAEDAFTALVRNAQAGGDSSSRGMPMGMIYGAAGLLAQLPDEWALHLRSANKIQSWVEKIILSNKVQG